MFVLRVPSLIKLCRTEKTSWAGLNQASMGFVGPLRGTFLSSILLEMVDKICFNSSVEFFFIMLT